MRPGKFRVAPLGSVHVSTNRALDLPPEVRLHVVSGKGGTGKTTVAAALALGLAARGQRVLLMEVEGRQALAQLFDTPAQSYTERRVALTAAGGEVHTLAVDAEQALMEYLEMFYNLRRAGVALRRMGAIDFATTVAPGLRDVLLTGKAIEAVKRRKDGKAVFDAVVLDAPPTGRVTRFLNVSSDVAGIARVGPIRNHADSVMGVLRSPRTAVHLVTLLEEMPVQETIDAIDSLQHVDLPVGSIIVNMIRRPLLTDVELATARFGRLDRTAVEANLRQVLPTRTMASGDVVTALFAEAADHAVRVEQEDEQRIILARSGRPFVELPFLSGGIDIGALYELGARLCGPND